MPDLVLDDTAISENVAPDTASTSQAKAKETSNVEPLSTDNEAEMDVVDALLSLSGVRDDGKDPTLDNEQLMPIGGANLPVDTAPVPIELGQVQVDYAIAKLAEQDEIQAQTATSKTDADNAMTAAESLDNVTIDKESNNTISKGVFKTTTHTLKKKTENKQSYKCSICGAKKRSMQLLNKHHKLHHRPQMCGICGRVFELAMSLNRDMYSHEEMHFQCEKCNFKCHFESELLSHNIVHRKTPTQMYGPQTVADGSKGNGNLQTTFVPMTKLCLSVTLVTLLQNLKNIYKSIKSGMKKICHTNVRYATKGFSTDLAEKDTRTKTINELLYVCCIICVHIC